MWSAVLIGIVSFSMLLLYCIIKVGADADRNWQPDGSDADPGAAAICVNADTDYG